MIKELRRYALRQNRQAHGLKVRFLSRRASLVFAMAAETMPNEGADPH
jgi:hypothetical protein